MKVRKEQFLLPKGENITSNAQWVQTSGKPCNFTKTLTSIASQHMIEGLASGLVTKVKPDFVLPNGDVLFSGSPGRPIYWQQQNGILRQALLNNEKDNIKVAEKINESINITTSHNQNEPCVIPNNGVLSIMTVTPQQLTPLATHQVIKMSDCQVILGESLPLSWQENNTKNKVVPVPPLTSPIEKKDWEISQMETSYVISDPNMSIGHLSNISVLCKNQYSTIVIKDGQNALTADLSPTKASSINTVPLLSNKSTVKSASKVIKGKKKTNQTKKIKIKPASSLLSKSALDYTNKDKVVPYNGPVEVNSFEELSIISEVELPENDGVEIDYTAKVLTEPIDLVTSPTSQLPNSMQTGESVNSLNSNDPFETIGSVPPSHCSSQDLNSAKISAESNIVFDATDVHLLEPTVEENNIIVTSSSSIVNHEEPLHLDETVVVDETIIDTTDSTNSPGICPEVESLPVLHENVLACDNNCDAHSVNITDFERNDHTHAILSSDIIEHEEQHTHEYTDNLLSQLSTSRVLPNMSSSQVSSVLNALTTSGKNDNNPSNSAKSMKSVKSEPSDYVKIEALNVQNISKLVNKESVAKYSAFELNNQTCFRCMKCMYLSLKIESIERHWVSQHQQIVEKNGAKRTIKCLGCPNVVYSKYSLQVHLLCDHNVSTSEVHELIAATFSANKSLREVKKQAHCKTTAQQKGKVLSPQTESEPMKVVPNNLPEEPYQSNIVSVITHCLSPVSTQEQFIETSVHLPQSDKDDEQKLSTDVIPELPPTPSFCLFSEVQEQDTNDKEISFAPDITSCDDNKELSEKKVELKSPVKCKTARNKLKSEFSNEVKITHRCMVDRCGVRVSNMVNLSYHLRCHKPNSDLLFCPECDYSVISWLSMTAHLWRKHSIDIDLFSCKHCNYKTNSYSRLINGHVKTHGEERPFLCDTCGKGFKTKKQMRNHKMIHRARRRNGLDKTGEAEGVDSLKDTGHTCHICSRSFADSRILKHHTANVHNRARPYFCSICTHSASSKSSLTMHFRQHTGEKPFSCDECDYKTSDHNSLRRHKMRHSGKRPYQCPHCPYNCIQATTYKSHLKNKHPGLDEGLMFSCPSCPFRTVKRDNYLSHKAQHDLGGDPRGKRKNTQQSPDVLLEHLSSPSSYLLQDDVVVLHDHTDDLSAAVQVEL